MKAGEPIRNKEDDPMAVPKIRLHNPAYQAKPEPATFFQPKRIPDLRGKSVVILDNAWWVWEKTLPTLQEALAKRYGVSKTSVFNIPRSGSPPAGVLEKVAREADCAVVCLAFGPPELLAVLEDAIVVAKAGLPTVCIVVQDHLYMWNKYAQSRKVILPVVTIPSNPEALPVEEAIGMMAGAIDSIVRALNNPVMEPPAATEEAAAAPFIEVPDSLDTMQDTMYRLGWTDGLPVIPPTEERVGKMIAQVRGDAEKVIGELPPLRGVATLTNIAANAVMAGCLPEHLPLLMAQVRACSQIEISLPIGLMNAIGTTMAIVNGPVRNELDINCARGLFGPGKRSNAALGRALQFMLRNIGGATAQVTQSNMSQPGRYTFCFGENEEESPWEPLHVERGFSPGTSTVTITSVTSIIQVATYTFDWPTMLDVFADAMAYFGSNIILQGAGMVWVFITPHHARLFARQGFSKKDVKEYIWKKARFPKPQFPEKLVPYPHHLLESNGQVLVVKSPDDINVVVAGAIDQFYGVVMTSIPTPAEQRMVATAAIT
jgi:hypothetical protein